MPRPHALEHADQADQPLTAQLTGQGCVLQICDSDTAGHARPPWAGCVVTGRVRICRPVPHATEQAVQAVQAPTSHLIGHNWVLHVCEATGLLPALYSLAAQRASLPSEQVTERV